MTLNDFIKKGTPQKLESYSFAKYNGILIIETFGDYVKAVCRPDCSAQALIELRRHIELPIQLNEVDIDTFNTLLTKNYESKSGDAFQVAEVIEEDLDLQQLLQELPNASSDLLESENDAPVIRLINALLREAILTTASDVHFETFEKTLDVRFRIDGILHKVLEVSSLLAPILISRLKVMASLDISEKRLPQDGRITVKIADRAVDIRASTIPINHGERVVLRLLDQKNVRLNLATLGMTDQLLVVVKRLISKPFGILLITGPTGSGKTTSLYAMLTELNVPDRNIMTVEDPIEYDLAGIGQIQVNPKIEMNFAKSLRAILRQDPNIIMIGEIRDLETAIIAVQTSLTGHLVLSTLHTNSAVGAIARLRDMGVESFLLASSLLGVIAQRLIRLLCKSCKEIYTPSPAECATLGIAQNFNKTIFQAKGCENCNQTGYKGRIGIYEVVEMDATLRTMIHDNVNEQQLSAYSIKQLPSIWQDSCQRVLAGETSLEEIIRVTSE